MLICESFVHSHILFKYMYMYCVLIYMQWENSIYFSSIFYYSKCHSFFTKYIYPVVLFFLQDI